MTLLLSKIPRIAHPMLFIWTILFVFFSVSGNAQTPPEGTTRTPPPQLEEEEGYLINFPNVNIIEYIRFISQITRKNFIFNEAELQFTVTILSEEPTSIENIIAALIQILRIHNLELLEQGNNLIIHKNEKIRQVPRVIDATEGETAIVTRVFQLKNVNPDNIVKIIRPLTSKGSLVEVSKETRHLIVTDIASNVEEVGKLLENLDAPNVSLDITTFSAKHTHIDSLVDLAEKIIKPLAEENPLVLVPQKSSDTIYIISTPYLLNRVLAILNALDIPSTSKDESLPPGHIDSTNFYIHKLQYHLGNKLIDALQDIGEKLGKIDITNQAFVAAIQSVQWLETSNSLLFTGDGTSLKKVRELVANLDIPLRQVFIEMLIIDTTVSNSLNFGVDWAARSQTADYSGSIASFNSGSNNPLKSSLPSGTVAPDASTLLLGEGFSFGVIGRSLKLGGQNFISLGALVRALQTDNDTNILLHPRIVTQDNHTASIFVGGSSAFQASQNVNNTGQVITVNVEYRDVGTLLKVTPILGPEDIVTLDIEQEMSESLGSSSATTAATLGPVTTKSSTKTRVHIPDRNFLIISGMIRDRKVQTNSKIPCLGSIPWVGETLFGNVIHGIEKKNLMIFLRPHIITSFEEGEMLTEKHKNRYYRQKGLNHPFDLDNIMLPPNP